MGTGTWTFGDALCTAGPPDKGRPARCGQHESRTSASGRRSARRRSHIPTLRRWRERFSLSVFWQVESESGATRAVVERARRGGRRRTRRVRPSVTCVGRRPHDAGYLRSHLALLGGRFSLGGGGKRDDRRASRSAPVREPCAGGSGAGSPRCETSPRSRTATPLSRPRSRRSPPPCSPRPRA